MKIICVVRKTKLFVLVQNLDVVRRMPAAAEESMDGIHDVEVPAWSIYAFDASGHPESDPWCFISASFNAS